MIKGGVSYLILFIRYAQVCRLYGSWAWRVPTTKVGVAGDLALLLHLLSSCPQLVSEMCGWE